jgi:branched-chain amino acid transport system ATP-binding protein
MREMLRTEDVMLEVKDLEVSYGIVPAIRNISFKVNRGEIFTILGANGAGKTTTLGSISGLVPPKGGSITLIVNGERTNLSKMPAYQIARLGVAIVPEGRGILSRMTVLENLQMGGLFARRDRKTIQSDIDLYMEKFPILKDRARQSAGNLSGGESQILAIVRGLMMKPRLLLLDEPSLGLAPLITAEIFKMIQDIRDEELLTIVLVEQNARKALEISDRGCLLETGSIVLQGTSEELTKDDAVVQAYLSSQGATKR